MAVNFPDSPSNGDSFSVNDTTYVYNATAGYWDITSTVQVSASTSINAPSNPSSGDFWFDPSSLTTYIYYNDGTSSQWVPANSVGARGPAGPGYPTAYYSAEYTSTSTGNVVFNANSTPSLASYSIGKVNVWVNGVLRSDFIASDGSNVEIALSTGDEVKIVNFGDTDVLDVTASSNDYATYTSLTSNDYTTYTTLSSLIDTVQSNVTSGSGGSGVVVYATPDLLPLSGNDAGDQAYVSSTNRLYINTGSGWYSIGLVNTNPNITSVQDANGGVSPFVLSSSGTATVITITASDPEEVPLTYSYAVTSGSLTNGGGTTATVVQGTGANTNQFTITPTTNASYGGTFNLTFTVSDGVNTASSSNGFTLQFSIPNSKHTISLIDVTDTSDNNNITDSSTNNHTITVNGDVEAGTFSPYRHGGYSTYFDGTGDSLNTTATQVVPTTSFTVAAWVYFMDTTDGGVWAQGTSGHVGRTGVSISSGNWYAQIGGSVIGTSTSVSASQWYYTELQWDGSTLEFFVDGSSLGSVSASNTPTNSAFYIGDLGSAWSTAYPLNGYVADVRVVSGTPFGSSIVPITHLTDIANTSLLTCHLPYIADGSSNGHSITINGNTSTRPFTPFNNLEYSSANHGGSVYFDGTGDYLSLPSSTSSLYLTGEFTYECWIYPTSTSGQIYGNWNQQTGNAWAFWFNNAGWQNGIKIWFYRGNYGQNETGIGSTTEMPINSWNHFAITRDSSNNIYIFLNGKSLTLSTYNHPNLSWDSSYSFTNTDPIGIGGTSNYSSFNGHISDAKFVNGSALYTSDFTPPTAPQSSTGSTLHVKGTDASIVDKSQRSILQLTGAVGTTASVKFAGTKSIDFSTISNDYYVTIPSANNGGPGFPDLFSGPCTIECWINPQHTQLVNGLSHKIIWQFTSGSSIFYLQQWHTDELRMTVRSGGSTFFNEETTVKVAHSTWYHVCYMCNPSTSAALYLDGVKVYPTAFLQNTYGTQVANMSTGLLNTSSPDTQFTLGSSGPGTPWAGYINDLRISNYNVYGSPATTSSFTPPTALFEG